MQRTHYALDGQVIPTPWLHHRLSRTKLYFPRPILYSFIILILLILLILFLILFSSSYSSSRSSSSYKLSFFFIHKISSEVWVVFALISFGKE